MGIITDLEKVCVVCFRATFKDLIEKPVDSYRNVVNVSPISIS